MKDESVLVKLKPKKYNRLFIEWYEGNGCGWENSCGKTEKEKMELAFTEGMKLAIKAFRADITATESLLKRKEKS